MTNFGFFQRLVDLTKPQDKFIFHRIWSSMTRTVSPNILRHHSQNGKNSSVSNRRLCPRSCVLENAKSGHGAFPKLTEMSKIEMSAEYVLSRATCSHSLSHAVLQRSVGIDIFVESLEIIIFYLKSILVGLNLVRFTDYSLQIPEFLYEKIIVSKIAEIYTRRAWWISEIEQKEMQPWFHWNSSIYRCLQVLFEAGSKQRLHVRTKSQLMSRRTKPWRGTWDILVLFSQLGRLTPLSLENVSIFRYNKS